MPRGRAGVDYTARIEIIDEIIEFRLGVIVQEDMCSDGATELSADCSLDVRKDLLGDIDK
jgi:hypothetical protein